jgi:hypothetical protein
MMIMENKFERIPSGIILLIVAISLEIVREIYSYFTQYNLFFGIYTKGLAFNIVNSILLLFSILVLFGFITMSKDLFYVIISYYLVMIANYLFVIINSGDLSIVTKSNSVSIVFLHLIGLTLFCLTIWYLFEKKMLFMHKKDDNLSVDGFFVATYVILFVLMIILSFAFTLSI